MSGKVLVLNQNYEPMSICNVQKAIILLYLGKAELIEPLNGQVIHSVKKSIPFPSIVRLSWYVKVPFKRAILSRKNILRRDNFRCQYCGEQNLTLTIDHIIPKAKNGDETWENLVTACIDCNNKKGDRSPEEANMSLITKPRRPNHVMFIKHCNNTVDDKWKPYFFMS